jgi:hypothetical protein
MADIDYRSQPVCPPPEPRHSPLALAALSTATLLVPLNCAGLVVVGPSLIGRWIMAEYTLVAAIPLTLGVGALVHIRLTRPRYSGGALALVGVFIGLLLLLPVVAVTFLR